MTILVTGATGAVGRLVIQRLVAEGDRVRAVSRSPRDAALPYGVEVVRGDPARPGTTAEHFAGVEAVFLHSRTFGDSADRLLALAAQRGVSRVVALSAMNIDDPFDLQPSRWRGDRNREADARAGRRPVARRRRQVGGGRAASDPRPRQGRPGGRGQRARRRGRPAPPGQR
ncbi:SDR family oxidoreductase [Microbispora bryophytorum]|uniref:SDR family oxidoreductase n=1 Tax=Microbispora bryophytorum TaxID=1460882 RepID=UPI0033E039FB